MKAIDVTGYIKKGYTDDGVTYILRCVCGYDKGFLIEENKMGNKQSVCPRCGRKFTFEVTVFEIKEEEE